MAMEGLRLFCGSLFSLLLLFASAVAKEPLGITKQRPKSGRAIECSQGWMVPYSRTIPGTNVGFEMVPIPGGNIEIDLGGQGAKIIVIVPPMWVSKYEVTWGEYKEYMKSHREFKESGVRRARVDSTYVTAPTELYSPEEVFKYSDSDEHPACAMSQFAARQYTKWLSLQLENVID